MESQVSSGKNRLGQIEERGQITLKLFFFFVTRKVENVEDLEILFIVLDFPVFVYNCSLIILFWIFSCFIASF